MEWLPQKVTGGRDIWVVTFDGGVDSRIGQGGSAFVVWHYNTGSVVDYGYQYSSDYASNNIEEYRGMISGIRAAKRWCKTGHDMIAVMGDSQLVVDHMNQKCKVGWKLSFWNIIARSLSRDELISFHWIRREINEATDFLSKEVRVYRNWWNPESAHAPEVWIDAVSTRLRSLQSILYAMSVTREVTCYYITRYTERVRRYREDVLDELRSCQGHRLYYSMRPGRWIMMGEERSGVHTRSTGLDKHPKWKEGNTTAIVPKVETTKLYTDMNALEVDARRTTNLLRGMDWNIGTLVKHIRNENTQRPNPDLNPEIYERELKGYSQLSLMKKVARIGVKVKLKSGFRAPRPWRSNFPIDSVAMPLAINKFAVEYNKSRGMLLNMRVAGSHVRDMVVSPIGAVEKGGLPMCEDVRMIVGLSTPGDQSINANTVNDVPDACFGLVSEIADRILKLRWNEEEGGEESHIKIMGMCGDIDAAFFNVPISADSVKYFANRIPGTKILFLPFNLVFGWKGSPGYFAIFAKAIRHLQNTAGYWLGYDWTNYWSFIWVDDIVLIEPDTNDLLWQAEWNIRQSVETVFGRKGWKHEKFETWSTRWKSLGLIWDSQTCTVEMPESKLVKAAAMLDKISGMKEVKVKELQSLLGKLRHLIICAPVAKPFVQRIQHLVNKARKEERELVTDMASCQADLKFWAENLQRINFTAWPLEFFGSTGTAAAVWTVGVMDGSPCIHWNGRQLTLAFRRTIPPGLAESIWLLLRAAQHWLDLIMDMNIRSPRILILLARADWRDSFNKGNAWAMKAQEAMRRLAVFQMENRVSFRAESWKGFGNEFPEEWTRVVQKANDNTNVCQIGNSYKNWMTLEVFSPCNPCARRHQRSTAVDGIRGRNSQNVSMEKYGYTSTTKTNRRPFWCDSYPIWPQFGRISGGPSKERFQQCGICTVSRSIVNWSRTIPFSPWWRKEEGRT